LLNKFPGVGQSARKALGTLLNPNIAHEGMHGGPDVQRLLMDIERRLGLDKMPGGR
jgi:hypothetical protein